MEKMRLFLAARPTPRILDELLAVQQEIRARVGRGRLARLHAQLAIDVEAAGVATEKREYFPHVTLLRFREPIRIPEGAPLAKPILFNVESVALFHSKLGRDGSHYEILREYPLARNS
jgi:2'-5' RNA ligase